MHTQCNEVKVIDRTVEMQWVEDEVMQANAEVDGVPAPKYVTLVAVIERDSHHALLAVVLLAALEVMHNDPLVLRELVR